MLRELQKLFESTLLSLLCVDAWRGMASFLSHAEERISQAILPPPSPPQSIYINMGDDFLI